MKFFVFVLSLFVVGTFCSDVLELTPSNFDQNVGHDDAFFVEFFAPWCGHCKALAPEWEILGTSFKNVKGVQIAKVDADAHRDLGQRFGVSGFPTILYFSSKSTEGERYQGGRTADDLIEFINQKIGTRVKQKKAPTNVVALTPSTFDDIVKDTNKNVLVEFYAPWCGHCKRLAPEYEKVGNAFEFEESVVIAKVDADAHKELSRSFGVSGYPTLKYFPADNKDGEPYNGGRSLDDFVKFINENAGTLRKSDGSLLPEAGIVSEYESMVKKFVSNPDDRQSIFEDFTSNEKKVDGLYNQHAFRVYRSAMKVLLKGKTLEKEVSRLERILESGSVAQNRVQFFQLRVNVLKYFQSFE